MYTAVEITGSIFLAEMDEIAPAGTKTKQYNATNDQVKKSMVGKKCSIMSVVPVVITK